MNLVTSFLGTNSSRWNDRSRAGPSTLLNFRRNDNKRWIPIAFHVYSRYFFAVIKDVHPTTTTCIGLPVSFTTMMQRHQCAHTAWLSPQQGNWVKKKSTCSQKRSKPLRKIQLPRWKSRWSSLLDRRFLFLFQWFLTISFSLFFFTIYSTIHTFHSIFYHFHFSAPCRCSLLPLIVFLFHEHSLFLSLSPPHSTSSFALSLTANLEKKLHELNTIIVCGPANHVLNLQ